MFYTIQTIIYDDTSVSYAPKFSDKNTEMLEMFFVTDLDSFPTHIQRVINNAIDDQEKQVGFEGNVCYIEIEHGIATIGNQLDDDSLPAINMDIYQLKSLVDQWLSDVKFLKTQMKQLPEKVPLITKYLKKEYKYTDKKAADAVKYLMQAREIAVEFVYYIEHSDFIPERYASNFHGYTAKRISQETILTLLGAFNCMVYLKIKPEKALAQLKRGFRFREIITPEQEEELKKYMD